MALKVIYKQGAQIRCAPELAYHEIERNRKANNGEIDLDKLVKDSKLKDAPLHNDFEWNNSKAAHKFRLEQARKIVRSIEIIRDETPNIQTRAFELAIRRSETPDHPTRRVYMSIEDVMQDPVARDELLARAIRDAVSFRKRYSALSELAQVFSALDHFLEHAEKVIGE